jgi:hypothetical protein
MNFKDVMNATGSLDEQATSGGLAAQKPRDRNRRHHNRYRIGISDLQVGNRVMGMARHGFEGSVVLDRGLVVP